MVQTRNLLFTGAGLVALSLLSSCATTTIQTAPPYPPRYGDDSRYFSPLSAQDEAFQKKQDDPTGSAADKNSQACPPVGVATNGQTDRGAAPALMGIPAGQKDPSAGDPSAASRGMDPPPQGGNSQPALQGKKNEDSYFGALNDSLPAGEKAPPSPNGDPDTSPDNLKQSLAAAMDQSRMSPDGSSSNDPAAGLSGPLAAAGADEKDFTQIGTASWYGRDFDGRKTASGDVFDSRKLTAAHKDIPLGSIVLVRNLENGKEVLVTVNDRGPYVKGRMIDLSEYGAELLGYKHKGLTTVGIKVVREGHLAQKSPGVTQKYYGESDSGASASGTGAAAVPGSTGMDGSQNNGSYLADALNGTPSGAIPVENRDARGTLPGPGPDASATNEQISPDAAGLEKEGSLKAYSVQVGVFEDMANAMSMKKYLNVYGQPIHIVQKGSLYIVKVGEFTSRFGAEKLKYQLVEDGYRGFVTEPDGKTKP